MWGRLRFLLKLTALNCWGRRRPVANFAAGDFPACQSNWEFSEGFASANLGIDLENEATQLLPNWDMKDRLCMFHVT